MTIRITSLVLVALVLSLGTLGHTRSADSGSVMASVVGEELEGSLTASGEPFRADGYTAASKTLPLGTRLLVKHEGRAVTLTVNDRGPFVPGRDLDISKGAAKAIGIYEKGVAPVEVEQIASPTPTSKAPEIVELPATGGIGQ